MTKQFISKKNAEKLGRNMKKLYEQDAAAKKQDGFPELKKAVRKIIRNGSGRRK